MSDQYKANRRRKDKHRPGCDCFSCTGVAKLNGLIEAMFAFQPAQLLSIGDCSVYECAEIRSGGFVAELLAIKHKLDALPPVPCAMRMSWENYLRMLQFATCGHFKVTMYEQAVLGLRLYVDQDLLPEEAVPMYKDDERAWVEAQRKLLR